MDRGAPMTETPGEPPGERDRSRKLFLVLLIAAALTTLVPRPLFDPDEGRYVATAIEMVESGDWFTPRLRYDLPHVSKPPLAYWLAAGSMEVFGRSVTAARLPWMLSFLATALAVGAIARMLIPGRETIAMTGYGTMLLPWAAACVITADTPLALFEVLFMLGFVRWLDRGAGRWLWLSWIALGLAALTKGPPGLLPLLPVLVFLSVKDRGRLRGFLSPLPVLAFLAMSVSWYGAQAIARPDVVDYWIGTEVVGRIASDAHERNSDLFGAVRVYLPTLLAGTLPWLLVLRGADRAPLRDDHRWLLALWFSLPLFVFVIARSRLPLYVLPLAAPAAIWIAASIDPRRIRRGRTVALVSVWVIALGCIAVATNVVRPDRNGELLARAILAETTETPDEIVFVNENPAWSLRFYLDRPLQRVNLFGYEDWGDLAYRPVAKSTAKLLSEREVRRVWLLPRHHYVAFRNEMREHGREIVRLGYYERLVFFEDRPSS